MSSRQPHNVQTRERTRDLHEPAAVPQTADTNQYEADARGEVIQLLIGVCVVGCVEEQHPPAAAKWVGCEFGAVKGVERLDDAGARCELGDNLAPRVTAEIVGDASTVGELVRRVNEDPPRPIGNLRQRGPDQRPWHSEHDKVSRGRLLGRARRYPAAEPEHDIMEGLWPTGLLTTT